ncbi:alpha/beta hydrolase [Catellatospora citrea]|uniref:alpha/beta fold hydrolase n=1 Tax=Catellatospora citrea TaxID=53366 RepID=UPI0033F6A592
MSERAGNTPVDESCVLDEGPWTHRFVNANGSRFHVVEQGTGPLVVLLHGFPEFWWAWHRQLPLLAGAGLRAVAVDLRGYGATDKPPRGYDGFTLAADVVGLIRALGERNATVVGAGAGGLVGWSAAALHPRLVNRLVVLGAAHPLRLRSALVANAAQRSAGRTLLRFQLPRYEHVLTRDDAALAGGLMRAWSSPAFRETADYAEYERRYREAIRIPQAAFCAMEAYRWAFRSTLRLHGYRFLRAIRQPIVSPTLQLQGALDPITLPATAQGSGRYVLADYEWRLLEDTGHFPHLERPDLVAGEIIRWTK